MKVERDLGWAGPAEAQTKMFTAGMRLRRMEWMAGGSVAKTEDKDVWAARFLEWKDVRCEEAKVERKERVDRLKAWWMVDGEKWWYNGSGGWWWGGGWQWDKKKKDWTPGRWKWFKDDAEEAGRLLVS